LDEIEENLQMPKNSYKIDSMNLNIGTRA
jgi:hypothetical protein